jgi:putative hydrolase of the HAD superfamily
MIMSRNIRAVLFDLGDTLMYPLQSWTPVLARANRALADALCDQGMEIDRATFHQEFDARLNDYYSQREASLQETSTIAVLGKLLEEKGQTGVTDRVIRTALDALYAVTQTNWALEEDAVPTLARLGAQGCRVGLVSNAGDNRDVFQLVDKFGIEPYFDFILTSAACGVRKPHPRIFELALAHWNIPAQEVAMVGDRLDADVLGANNAGMFSIWITRRTRIPDRLIAEPDATVQALSEIPQVVEKIRPENFKTGL